MNFKTIIYLVLVAAILSSCERDLLNEEQYKNIIYIKSGDDHILTYPYQMNDAVARGYITIGSGGSLPLKEDLGIRLAVDTSSLNSYNYRVFGNEVHKYAQLLPSRYYDALNLDAVLQKGVASATVAAPVDLRVSSLSPDTTYMIPIKIASASGAEVNPEKDFVLLAIGLENGYSTVASRSYRMKGIKQVGAGFPSTITATKTVLPLGSDRVRLFPENVTSSNTITDINNKAIVLVINSNNNVDILPYKNVIIEPVGTCKYDPVQKEFTLNYRYKLTAGAQWITINENLTWME